MRQAAWSFLAGSLIGMSIGIAVYRIALPPAQELQHATETLDFLIDEWSKDREPDVRRAQITRELPDAKLGFFPDTVRALAQMLQDTFAIPEGVVLAQWALESRWGLSALGASNYFGHTYAAVKSYMEQPQFVLRRERVMRGDSIVAGPAVPFAHYRTIAESFKAHGAYLRGSTRYRKAFAASSPEEFARRLSEGGYATDPDYALKLIAIMRRHKLN